MDPKPKQRSKVRDSIAAIIKESRLSESITTKKINIREYEEMPSKSSTITLKEFLDNTEEEAIDEEFTDEEIEDNDDEFEQPTYFGQIDLSYPERLEFESSEECYPSSYYTVSPKERLILMFAENFRRQFAFNYAHRRPLVLAVPNECCVQKFVSTTLRPTAFLHRGLFRDFNGICKFVADFIIYEPLKNPIALPPRLMSPDTLLRRRRGNSYEMATLLCSMLIAAGYPAMVVNGSARPPVLQNDQKKIRCPFIPTPAAPAPVKIKNPDIVQDDDEDNEDKYKLRPPLDLESHLAEELQEIARIRDLERKAAKMEQRRIREELFEISHRGKNFYRKYHAWVAVIENAPWSLQPKKTRINEDGDEVVAEPTAILIEPSTGFIQTVNARGYIRVESMWDNFNYYVNLQECDIKDMKWNLLDGEKWEHFLPGEPVEMRVQNQSSEENLEEIPPELFEKHLDFIQSWVQKLHIGDFEYDRRFPNESKTVLYKRCKHERFSPYTKKDGVVEIITLYSDLYYENAIYSWTIYKNRSDLLDSVKLDYENLAVEECFNVGRPDGLKMFEHSTDLNKPRTYQFYFMLRQDSLKCLEIYQKRVVLHFQRRSDFLNFQEFKWSTKHSSLEQISERFHPNPNKTPSEDIAYRIFYINANKIFIKFQYEKGALTASLREFIKPQKPDYGNEIIFNPKLTKGYHANPNTPPPTELQLYQLLLQQLKYEDQIKSMFESIYEREVIGLNEVRMEEMMNPRLTFRMNDPLRNGAARLIRLKRNKDEEIRRATVMSSDPDTLGPYLVHYDNRKLTVEESTVIYNACLKDVKTRFITLLNELQRSYEDLTHEGKALKKFLSKFQNQFDNFDYEQLVEQAKTIELNRRMVQQRLTRTHDEAQSKYEKLKQTLLSDPRLTLINNEPIANTST